MTIVVWESFDPPAALLDDEAAAGLEAGVVGRGIGVPSVQFAMHPLDFKQL